MCVHARYTRESHGSLGLLAILYTDFRVFTRRQCRQRSQTVVFRVFSALSYDHAADAGHSELYERFTTDHCVPLVDTVALDSDLYHSNQRVSALTCIHQ